MLCSVVKHTGSLSGDSAKEVVGGNTRCSQVFLGVSQCASQSNPRLVAFGSTLAYILVIFVNLAKLCSNENMFLLSPN